MDEASIEISGNKLQVRASGITTPKASTTANALNGREYFFYDDGSTNITFAGENLGAVIGPYIPYKDGAVVGMWHVNTMGGTVNGAAGTY